MEHETLVGSLRIALAWLGVVIASINFTATLTVMVLLLTAVFTALQIYKILHDIKRQKRLDSFAETLRDD